jgi:urea transport system ATP-binding protein
MNDRILSVEALTVGFNGFTVLDQLDFSMNFGELRFLIGPNGAGKTTLLDSITGKTKPSSGRILFTIDLAKHQEHDLVRLGIGRKFQAPSVFNSLTVFQNLEAAIGFRSRLTNLFRSLSNEEIDRIEAVLEQVDLSAKSHHPAATLSHGERQWLEIAMLLIQEPQLLLLDEPVAGMTRREREHTGALLQAISKEHSVLVVEHDMEFVRQFSDTVTVLHLGKVLNEGKMEDLQEDERVIEAYLGHGSTQTRREAVVAV